MNHADASSCPYGTSALTHRILFVLCALLIILTTIAFAQGKIADIYAYYAAGRLYWQGQLADAYHAVTMLEAQRQFVDSESFMPWTYPPQFNLLTIALAKFSLPLAYLLFIVPTFVAFLFVIRLLEPQRNGYVLIIVFPAIMITIHCGQAGFLIGSLAATFCFLMLKRRPHAGVPLALLAVKPHLCIGICLIVLLTGSWRVLVVALTTLLLLVAASTLVFGVGIWPAFLGGLSEAGEFLQQGSYPLYRMVSVYAGLFTMGVPAGAALVAQGAVALMALSLIAWAWHRKWPLNQLLAVAMMATMLVSPYAYDYDVTLIAVGLALVAREVLSGANTWDKNLIVVLGCFTAGVSILQYALFALRDRSFGGAEVATGFVAQPLSLGWIGLILLLLLVVSSIRRHSVHQADGDIEKPRPVALDAPG